MSKNKIQEIELISDYKLMDMLILKKFQQCYFHIPETIFLEKGVVKQWIFNSHKISNHPILKKKKQNLTALNVIKSLCSLMNYSTLVSKFINVNDIRDQVLETANKQKDYDFVKDKKVIEISTTQGDTLQMSLFDFLNQVAEKNLADVGFNERWKMIQEKVSHGKIQQCYIVQNTRQNHIIESKCHKMIQVGTGLISSMSNQLQSNHSKQIFSDKIIQVAQNKTIQGYKFFDTFLNKKFFQISNDLIQFIEKNYKCIVMNIQVKFVINKQRQPYLVALSNLSVKPHSKIVEVKEYRLMAHKGTFRIQEYLKCLMIYINQLLQRQKMGLNSHINQQTRFKCKGQFCNVKTQTTSSLIQPKVKLPVIGNVARKINSNVISAVSKRKKRVIDILKQQNIVSEKYQLEEQSSSQCQSSDRQQNINILKVCENCYLFYLNVMRFFDVDAYINLTEKKSFMIPEKKNAGLQTTQKKILPSKDETESIIDKNNRRLHSLDNDKKYQTPKILRQKGKSEAHLKKNSLYMKSKRIIQTTRQQNESNKSKLKPIQTEQMLQKKLQNTKRILSNSIKNKPVGKQVKEKFHVKISNFEQAGNQLVKKIAGLISHSPDELAYYAQRYWKDNLPQEVERYSYNSQYLKNIYQFMNNTPISLEVSYRIKRRPQMSLKRLSELTNYPQIVSKSTFIFDTLICDEYTTISYCVISSTMIHKNNKIDGPFENIIMVLDLFDCYIQYISLVKDMLEDMSNKQVILFNYPGQSHTIFDTKQPFHIPQFSDMLDKLIYRLSNSKSQKKIINVQKDTFKFCGIGYGSFFLSNYLFYFHQYYPKLIGIMIINGFTSVPQTYYKMAEELYELYKIGEQIVTNNSFLYYNKAIKSTQVDNDALDHKSGLNSIQIQGRIYLLQNILTQKKNVTTNCYEKLNWCPIHILYGRDNAVVGKQFCQRLLEFDKNDKMTNQTRKLIEVDGGHDLMADNYDDLQKNLSIFFQLN